MNELRGRRFLPKIMTVIVALMMLIPSAAFADSNTDGFGQDYKATGSLTDADKSDANQKNYQKADGSNADEYLYKSAEWTDRDAGKATIKLKCKPKVQEERGTAVYAFTPCNAHNFEEEIATSNMAFLLNNYDQVDIIVPTSNEAKDIKIIKNIGSLGANATEAADNALASLTGTEFQQHQHWNNCTYEGLYDYLMGETPGKETKAGVQKEFPAAIYVSLDAFVDARPEQMDGNGTSEVRAFDGDCWDIIQSYEAQGRYFSMGCSADPVRGETNSSDYDNIFEVRGYGKENANDNIDYLCANKVVGLIDPTLWIGMDKAKTQLWNGSRIYSGADVFLYSGLFACYSTVRTDYKYDQSFEALEIPIVGSASLYDSVSSQFKILSATADDSNAKVTVNGNTVYVSLEKCTSEKAVVVTIEVQLKDLTDTNNQDKWLDTNNSNAILSYTNGDEENALIAVTSPKLFYDVAEEPSEPAEKYTITTEVENGTIDQSITDITKGDSKTINYTPNEGYVLKSVTVDGQAVDIATYPEKYEFKDIAANHDVKVVYEKEPVVVEKYTITTEVVNGTIDPSITNITKGDSKTINYSPAEGFELKSVTVDGQTVDIATYSEKYEFKDIAANHAIKVIYDKKAEPQEDKYTITTEVVNGTIDPSITNITKNDSKTISYSPAEGFELKSVTVDGQAVNIATYSNKYEFKDIAANHAIKVVYEPKAVAAEKYTITTEVVNGSIDPSITNIAKNDNKTIEYSPEEGFKLMSVTVDSKTVDIATYPDKYDFEKINADHAIKVVYEKKAVVKEDPTNPGSDPGENNPTEDTDNAVQTGEDTGMILLSILLGTMAAIAATAVAVRRKTTR